MLVSVIKCRRISFNDQRRHYNRSIEQCHKPATTISIIAARSIILASSYQPTINFFKQQTSQLKIKQLIKHKTVGYQPSLDQQSAVAQILHQPSLD